MKNIALVLLVIALLGTAQAATTPGLYSLLPNKVCQTVDYNILVEHIQELERKVSGMQKQITILHSKVRKLEASK